MSEFDIPESWTISKLENLSNIFYGKNLPSKKRIEGKFPVISSAGIIGSHNQFMLEGPIIVTGRKGTLSNPFLIQSDSWVIDTAFAIKPFGKFSIGYIYWLIKNSNLEKLQSSTAIPSLSRESLYSIDVPIPPLKEQKRIACKIKTCFQKATSIEKNLDEAEEILEKYRESLLAKAFRGELVPQNPNDEPASVLLEKIRAERKKDQKRKKKKQEIIPVSDKEKHFDIPESWEWIPLLELSERKGGGTPSRKIKEYYIGKIPWITVADIPKEQKKLFNISTSREFINENAIRKSSSILIPCNSIILSTRVSVGKVGINTQPICTNQDFSSFIHIKINPKYLGFYLLSINNLILKNSKGTTVKGVGVDYLNKIRVPVPPFSEQKIIVKKIEFLLEELIRLEQQIKQKKKIITNFKESILSKAFKGELVEQIPEEGTGHELLAKIMAEKERQEPIKKKKISKKTKRKKKKS